MPAQRPTLVDQVREQMLELISDGTYAVGDRLPNEQEMSERFQVSRATVREAYRALIDMGYLLRKHGTGTFLARVPQRHALDHNLSYTQMIRAAGFEPSIRVVSQQLRDPDEEDRKRLRLEEGEKVIAVERVRLADDRPVVYSVDRIPARLVPEERRDKLPASLFDFLEELHHGARNGRARILPVLAGEREAKHLQVEEGTPLLFFDEVDFDQAGMPVMGSFEWHTSDVFELWINRRATSTASASRS
mgnify:CR=1 FL=1